MEKKSIHSESSVKISLSSKPRWYRFIPIGIFIFAIASHSLIIFFYLPPVQFQKYTIASRMYVHEELPKERLMDFSPLYFAMHIVLQKIFPRPDSVIQWLQIVLTGVSSLLLFYLLLEFFQHLLALFGTLAFILNHSVIIYTQAFEPEPLLIFFLLGFVFFATRSNFLSHGVAGVFFGLSILTRPNFLAVFAAVPVYFYFRQGRNKRKCLTSTALILVPLLLSIGVLSGRNAVILKNISPMTMIG